MRSTLLQILSSASTSWVALALLAAISAAGVALFGKLAVNTGDVASATFTRSLIMSAILAAYLISKGGSLIPAISGSHWNWLWIILAGLCGAISWLAYFTALKHGSATGVAVIDRGSIVFTVLLAMMFLGERPGLRATCGLLIIVVGLVLVATSPPMDQARTIPNLPIDTE